ncbi:uncharacterized protein BDFB_002825, partial [Asbolus verrucosus]
LKVSQTKINSLESYKKKKGPFKSLNELLEVDGLGVKVLEKLCQQIISDKPDENIKKASNGSKKMKQFLVPPLSSEIAISSAVGIHIAPMGVSWAKLHNSENKLECWGYQDFINLPKKMFPMDTFKLAMHILNNLPVGDVYVFEGTSNMGLQGQKQPSTVTSYTQQIELSSMLLALINTSSTHNTNFKNIDKDETEILNSVYFLRSKLPARLFKTLVGNECVSSTTTILQLLDSSVLEEFTLPCTPITLDKKIKNDYLSQSSAHKELLGQALMLTIAFTDLCVKRNSLSLNAVVPKKK